MAFDRLRFDFNYGYALTDTQLEEIERLINGWIEAATFLLVSGEKQAQSNLSFSV